MSSLVIFGSRGLNISPAEIDRQLKSFNYNEVTELVSGGADGVDRAGEIWANLNKIPIRRFLPDWSRWGKAAGKKRNEEMARFCDEGLGFWDGDSPGTANMCAWLEVLNKSYTLVLVK